MFKHNKKLNGITKIRNYLGLAILKGKIIIICEYLDYFFIFVTYDY